MKKTLATLLLFASLLPAGPRKQAYQSIALSQQHTRHAHRRLWLTIGILTASGITTGAILAQSKRNPQPVKTTCNSDGSKLCYIPGGLR